MSAGLDARVVVRWPRLTLDAALDARAGEVVAVLGPNGAGKSTLLGVLAGLVQPDAGRVVLDEVVLDDPSAGVRVPTERRGVGLVFQGHLLFPHLSAADNVAFGLRCRGVGRRDAREQAQAWLARMGLSGLAGERPARLSGGQAQRVALARTLATQPRLLLLDEPLSALDAGTRPTVRADLRHHLAWFAAPAVVVTHDPVDAMVLADRIAVLENGAVVQHGFTQDVARHPRTDYVARLVGLNLLRGRAEGHRVALDGGGEVALAHEASGSVLVAFSPSTVTVSARRPEGSARNVWPGRVVAMESRGDLVRIEVAGQVPVVAEVTPAAVTDLGLHPDVDVHVSVKATEISCYPA